MDELRKDPILDRWVAIAPRRGARPHALHVESVEAPAEACPFCAGREEQTPAEVFAIRPAGTAANGPGWRLRVVPNRYPALEQVAKGDARMVRPPERSEDAANRQSGQLFVGEPALGAHEVIIESPRHIVRPGDLDEVAWEATIAAYRQRLAYWRGSSLACGVLFKNVGAEAGASLPHVHSQLIVLPRVPQVLADELRGACDYYDLHQRCVFCALIDQEQAAGARMVLATDEFVAFCPYASRFPYETWILPKAHSSDFDQLAEPQVAALGNFMRTLTRRIEALPEAACYNLVIHTAPFDSQGLSHYHWHVELTPRGTRLAGYELGTGYYINPLPPELAAERLRMD